MNSAGERFEFENTMLLDVRRLAIPVAQVGMPAVYQEEGKYTSHFNKVKDSIRIYKLLLGRALLPLFAALVAFALFLALVTQVPGLQVGGVHLGAPIGYLAGWILLLPSLQQRGKGILAGALGMRCSFGCCRLIQWAHGGWRRRWWRRPAMPAISGCMRALRLPTFGWTGKRLDRPPAGVYAKNNVIMKGYENASRHRSGLRALQR